MESSRTCAVRLFELSDLDQIRRLFHDTVHAVNSRDYQLEQLAAWAPEDFSHGDDDDRATRLQCDLSRNMTYVAEMDDEIVGFGDITSTGYLDHMYVHKDRQRQGIASSLLRVLERDVRPFGVSDIQSDVSITARPFFEYHGYHVVRPQMVQIRGVSMMNFKMVKKL